MASARREQKAGVLPVLIAKRSAFPRTKILWTAYCKRMGISGIPDFGFYLAFCFFRMGAILQGVKKRALDGNASNPEQGLRLGKAVPGFAKGGLEAIQHG
jgi:hypothetical protein